MAPLVLPLLAAALRFGWGVRVEDRDALRRAYARARRESEAPLLICANHLTMIDSAIIAWALGSPGFYLRDLASLPWNTPEQTLFAAGPLRAAGAWLLKCLPLRRGGKRADTARVLGRVTALLSRGDVVLIFPEGRRSRSGRVETEAPAWGVGRVVRAVPGCRVLCVYLRGEHQTGHSALPRRGERFRARIDWLEPKSERRGLRGSVEVVDQIVTRLAALEREVLDAR